VALFTYAEFASYLKQEIDNSTKDVVDRVASGWLMSVTSQATWYPTWPSPLPDNLFAWALELAAIAYRNPDGVASETIDDYTAVTDRARRAEILKAAAAVYGSVGSPLYSFPDPDWHWTVVPVVSPLVA
jgi:hypothetical protein